MKNMHSIRSRTGFGVTPGFGSSAVLLASLILLMPLSGAWAEEPNSRSKPTVAAQAEASQAESDESAQEDTSTDQTMDSAATEADDSAHEDTSTDEAVDSAATEADVTDAITAGAARPHPAAGAGAGAEPLRGPVPVPLSEAGGSSNAAQAKEPTLNPLAMKVVEGARFTTPAFKVSPLVDGVITGALLVTALSLWAAHDSLVSTTCPCDRSDVPTWETFAVDLDYAGGEDASNVAVALALGAPAALLSLDTNVGTYFKDLLLVIQAGALAGLITQITKTAVGRPYPYMYRDNVAPLQLDRGENYASMMSGHTAIPMAGSLTFAAIWWRRYPNAWHRYLVAALGPVLAVTAGLFQMSAGNHFPSDIIAGGFAGLGSAAAVVGGHLLWEMWE